MLGALEVPPDAAIDVVSRLASRSLVIVDEPPRYRLLESIRAFALEALAASAVVSGLVAVWIWWVAIDGGQRRAVITHSDEFVHRGAHAYLMYPDGSELSEEARARLADIRRGRLGPLERRPRPAIPC